MKPMSTGMKLTDQGSSCVYGSKWLQNTARSGHIFAVDCWQICFHKNMSQRIESLLTTFLCTEAPPMHATLKTGSCPHHPMLAVRCDINGSGGQANPEFMDHCTQYLVNQPTPDCLQYLPAFVTQLDHFCHKTTYAHTLICKEKYLSFREQNLLFQSDNV